MKAFYYSNLGPLLSKTLESANESFSWDWHSTVDHSLDDIKAVSPPDTTWIYVFWILWLHRYVRTIVHSISHYLYKSYPLPETPKLLPKDVTVIVPTIHHNFWELKPSLQSILDTNPAYLMLVTTNDRLDSLQMLAKSFNDSRITVLATDIANKRIQVCKALGLVQTEIIVLADDDVYWPRKTLRYLLAPFDADDHIAGVGTCQKVRRLDPETNSWDAQMWNWLGAAYIERRNFEISATHNIDGGTSCMSGRTGAYRRSVLLEPGFLESFRTETWGNNTLNADDDNFITRWLVNHQWKTWVQYDDECLVETTLEDNPKFLYQCTRWARSNWRSNWTSLVLERYVWSQQLWCTYALHFATFTSLAFVMDPFITYCCWKATEGWDHQDRLYALWAHLIFVFGFTKVIKLVGLFRRNPRDICFLPVSILFGWFHGLIKIYALFTLNMTSWGSRTDADKDDQQRLIKLINSSTPLDNHGWPDLD